MSVRWKRWIGAAGIAAVALGLLWGLAGTGALDAQATPVTPGGAARDASGQRAGGGAATAPITLLNVSYDPTRELYQDIDAVFAAGWQAKTGQTVTVNQSHGGSGKQARAVIDGLQADIVTLALAYDIDAIAASPGQAERAPLARDWQARLPHHSAPFTSTIVLLVRKGNPKQIKDWDDLARPGVSVITPNPKTSGGARWNYLAAWAYALRRNNGDARKAEAFVTQLYRERAGARLRGAWRDDDVRAAGDWGCAGDVGERGAARDREARSRQVRDRRAVGQHPRRAARRARRQRRRPARHAQGRAGVSRLPLHASRRRRSRCGTTIVRETRPWPRSIARPSRRIELFTVDEVFGGWAKAQREHFNDGGVFDRIYQPGTS